MELEVMSFEVPVSKSEDGTITYQQSDISKVKMPPNKYVATLSIGQRFITTDEDGSYVGIEVVNISDDYTSDLNKPIRMVNLRKV